MPRKSTLAVRQNQLRLLKETVANHRDRDLRIQELGQQIQIATKANFPASALDALARELKHIEELRPDPQIAEKIDVLERWVSAELAFQKLFTSTRQGRRGRPRKAT